MKPRNVLCIDDEETCLLYDSLFSAPGRNFNLTRAAKPAEAIHLIKREKFDLYIIEPHGRDFDGIEFCKFMREMDSETPIIIYSGTGREEDRIQGLAAGANAYFVKPADLDKFIKTVNEFLN